MIFRRSFLASLAWAVLAANCASAQEAPRFGRYFWPTPSRAFIDTGRASSVAQPTESGATESALFGCVRNDGRRFHEGIDLKATTRDKRGEPLDSVYAFDDGIVRYVNRRPGTSSYGNYIVVEHPRIAPGIVSVYAHLRTIPQLIEPGVAVKGGQMIAVMGHTAGGYRIPQSRAHLHFEIGLWLGDDFQKWYDAQPFDSKNDHGDYNGMNIIGFDVWDLLAKLRSGEAPGVWEYAMSEPVAARATVRSAEIPRLLSVNPSLMQNVALPSDLAGWEIDVTWYGMPLRFRALGASEMQSGRDRVEVVALRPELLRGQSCMDLVREGPLGGVGAKLNSLMRRLFPE